MSFRWTYTNRYKPISQIIYVAIEISQSIILNNGNTFLALYMDEIVSINKDVSSLGLKWIL